MTFVRLAKKATWILLIVAGPEIHAREDEWIAWRTKWNKSVAENLQEIAELQIHFSNRLAEGVNQKLSFVN